MKFKQLLKKVRKGRIDPFDPFAEWLESVTGAELAQLQTEHLQYRARKSKARRSLGPAS